MKGAKEIKPKFLPIAIIFEGLEPIIKRNEQAHEFCSEMLSQFYRKYIFIKNLQLANKDKKYANIESVCLVVIKKSKNKNLYY